ncbi:LTA synthase family protein [Virgibacillus chiguensis]|uniref:Phosphoglycerol transferase MdoB n=1 Tax=Virgibacillus chiguensis TaxID=411959 RepID=A0A1M5LUQ9_9BACI|nr:LTA synthase family protein [Virgibacillus chiguensis]SHG68735.1 Phosphoglycerol transferase MdoB [Virgibacillus chiguensis]
MKQEINKIPLFILATILFGIKTYLVYRFMFSIDLENMMQEIILLINPFVSGFLIFALSVWIKKPQRQMKYLRYTILIGTLIIFANLVFYRSFTDFITIPQLFQASNAADLGSSILTLIKPYDILLFVDVVIIWFISRKQSAQVVAHYPKSGKVFALAMSFVLLAGNFFLAEMERPQLFTRAFDREYLVKNIGLFNYHIYDIATQAKAKTQRVFADGNELPEIQKYMDENMARNTTSELFGVAEGKNVIFINAESIQSFVINNDVNGEPITPFLNALTKDKDTFYFENFYHQTEQGKTSDSEFLVENSLYPLSRGAVFFTHGQNEYNAMPEILGENGYYSSVVHANNKSFWNRDQMYQSLGFDHYYGEESFEITEENSVGWGLKDKPFFEQSTDILQRMEKPFYTKLITLTNHFPFELDEEDRSIEPYDSNSNTLNNFFPTVRYMDESIELFFDELKRTGLYEDSIIVIMGDHYGISANHNKAMSQYLGKEEITPYDHIQLQRVPLFIHIPGFGKGEIKSEIAGQIDMKPTLLNLLGIKNNQDIQFGNDLFSKQRKDFIALRNGSFITDEYIYTNDTCYNKKTGEPVEKNQEEDESKETSNACDLIRKQVGKELDYSDDLIYGDLFRFIDFKKNK